MTNKPRQSLIHKLHGILLPTPTPFDSDEAFDAAAFRSNLARWSQTGISGYAVLGSTGERVHTNENEYVQIIEVAREVVTSDFAFIVGAGQQSIKGTVAEIRAAANAGADAVLVLTPYFYKTAITQDTLLSFYRSVAESSPVPVILYSMPALTGIKIEAATIAELCHHPNIIGVKDSSADLEGLTATIRLVGTDPGNRTNGETAKENGFAVMTGNGTVLSQALQAGAVGGILAVGCVAPDLCIQIFEAVRAGATDRAKELQEKLTPLAQAVTTGYGIGGLKAALDFIGFRGGSVRAPLQSPNDGAQKEIRELLARASAGLSVYPS